MAINTLFLRKELEKLRKDLEEEKAMRSNLEVISPSIEIVVSIN